MQEQKLSFVYRLNIICPHCGGTQRVEHHKPSDTWFQIGPFCCEIMQIADSPEWNRAIDYAINRAKYSC